MKASDIGKDGILIAKVKSDHTDLVYEIRLDKGVYNCTCLGYRSSKSIPRQCKHIRRHLNATDKLG